MLGKIVNRDGENIDYTLHSGDDQVKEIVVIGHGVTGNKDRPFVIELANAIAKTGIHVLDFHLQVTENRTVIFQIPRLQKK